MKDEEFVKLKHWLDAEITLMHIYLVAILGALIHNKFVWVLIAIFIVYHVMYAAVRINYVESKQRGYLKVPNRWN